MAAAPGRQDAGEILHDRGLRALRDGDGPRALNCLRRAIAMQPEAAHYWANLGAALRRLGRPEDAAAALIAARRLRPGSAEIASNLGVMLTDLEQPRAAIQVLREAVALDPGLADAHYNLGHAMARFGHPAAALDSLREALRLRPGFADAAFNLGHTLARLGRPGEAAAAYRRAIAADPDHAAAHGNLGVLLQFADRLEEAAAHFGTAARLHPDDPAALCNLAAALLAMDRRAEAASRYRRVLATRPDHGDAAFGRLLCHLPVVAADAAELAAGRAEYAAGLARLARRARSPRVRVTLGEAGGAWPFFLAYQGGPDRRLAATHGRLLHRLAAAPAPLPAPPGPDEPIRVGLISGFFRDHTIHRLFLDGWLSQFDRRRFALFGYHTGHGRDAATARAAARCRRFVAGPLDPQAWRAAILADAPHVLIYPEIGIDPAASLLAAQRLAPLQCAAWGHPVTTGLPSIDLFLSGDAMEPAGAAAHYTERLVRLPGLGIHVEPEAADWTGFDRARFGLRESAVAYWSGQSLPKYHPDHDGAFVRIAHAVPDSQFVFIGFGRSREVTSRFAERLHRAFARGGLRAADHVVMLPPLNQQEFMAALSLCDVVLDTPGWSGGRSTLDALATDPAIVTLAGRTMRSRHTAAILQLMGADQTVTRSLDAYVAMAVRLGREPQARQAARARVAGAKHRIWRDRAAIEALQDVLECTVRGATTGAPRPVPPPPRPREAAPAWAPPARPDGATARPAR